MIGALTSPVQLSRSLPGSSDVAARLAAIDARALQRAGSWLAGLSAAMADACAAGEDAVGEVSRGWSTAEPALRITRLLSCAEQTAAVLHAAGVAVDAAYAVVRDQQTNAVRDVAVAVAEINALRSTITWADVVGGAFGAPVLADDIRVVTILDRLQAALTARLDMAQGAIGVLTQQLADDPTVGPDGLRGGPDALLPPDPVNNPANRTDTGNRAALDSDLRSDDPNRVRFAGSIADSLRHAGRLGSPAQLVVYDATAFDGQGRAAIALGDLTAATNVAVVVPGITNSPSAMSGGIDLTADLRKEATRQDPGDSTAVVAWYGYDIPGSWTKDPGPAINTDIRDTLAVGSAANAASGAPLLAADLTAMKAMAQTSARLTVLGFSMGATTVSEAARFPIPADAMVLMGAPGAGWDTRTASGYASIRAAGVYSLSYDEDPVTLAVTDRLASDVLRVPDPYGVDPATEAFGGNHIDVTTNVPITTGTGLLSDLARLAGDPRHHSMSNYMAGAALAAEGAIVVGRGRTVPTKRGRH